jgi:hypothetical protein
VTVHAAAARSQAEDRDEVRQEVQQGGVDVRLPQAASSWTAPRPRSVAVVLVLTLSQAAWLAALAYGVFLLFS